jgi:hypothetical protein
MEELAILITGRDSSTRASTDGWRAMAGARLPLDCQPGSPGSGRCHPDVLLFSRGLDADAAGALAARLCTNRAGFLLRLHRQITKNVRVSS